MDSRYQSVDNLVGSMYDLDSIVNKGNLKSNINLSDYDNHYKSNNPNESQQILKDFLGGATVAEEELEDIAEEVEPDEGTYHINNWDDEITTEVQQPSYQQQSYPPQSSYQYTPYHDATPYQQSPIPSPVTTEIPKKQHIDNAKFNKVFNEYENESVVMDDFEDEKNILIFDIEEYQEQLIDNDMMKEDKRYDVNTNTSLSKLREIHGLLKVKYYRSRYISVAINAIEGTAYVMGLIFNGERSIGSIEFDLTDWHKQVRKKALLMRSDIGSCFKDTMIQNTSPFTRIIMELGIHGFMYGVSNARKKKNKAKDYDELVEFKK